MKPIMCERLKCKHLYEGDHVNYTLRCNKIKNMFNVDLYVTYFESDFLETYDCLTPGKYYYEKIKAECKYSKTFQQMQKLRSI